MKYFKHLIVCLILVAILVSCQGSKKPLPRLTVTHQAAVLTELLDTHMEESQHQQENPEDEIMVDENASSGEYSNVMANIVSQLHGKKIAKKKEKKEVLKTVRTANSKILSKLKNTAGFKIISRVLRPFKPRFCNRLIYLKSLRRKLITSCIVNYHRLGFLASMRVRLASTTNLLLNAKYDGCTTSRMVKSLEAKIVKASSCLKLVNGIHTIVSPVGVLANDN